MTRLEAINPRFNRCTEVWWILPPVACNAVSDEPHLSFVRDPAVVQIMPRAEAGPRTPPSEAVPTTPVHLSTCATSRGFVDCTARPARSGAPNPYACEISRTVSSRLVYRTALNGVLVLPAIWTRCPNWQPNLRASHCRVSQQPNSRNGRPLFLVCRPASRCAFCCAT